MAYTKGIIDYYIVWSKRANCRLTSFNNDEGLYPTLKGAKRFINSYNLHDNENIEIREAKLIIGEEK